MLYAGENKLTHLPDQFGRLTKLEELDLSGCELTVLPESLSLCRSLVHVWLTGNKYVTLINSVLHNTQPQARQVDSASLRYRLYFR